MPLKEQFGAPKGTPLLMAPAKNGTQGTADVHSCDREPAAEEVTNLLATTPRSHAKEDAEETLSRIAEA